MRNMKFGEFFQKVMQELNENHGWNAPYAMLHFQRDPHGEIIQRVLDQYQLDLNPEQAAYHVDKVTAGGMLVSE